MFSVIDVHESGDGPLYVEDVFSAFTYTGNGSTQSVVNGIDLSGKGGLVWIKGRSGSFRSNSLIDTVRGIGSGGRGRFISSDQTAAQMETNSDFTGFLSNGYTLGPVSPGGSGNENAGSETYIGWTFRKAKKFFDVKTYTGNGVAGRQIAHDLGVAPGMIIVKRLDAVTNWVVQHRSVAASNAMFLNLTNAAAPFVTAWNSTVATDTVFTLGSDVSVNGSGGQYVAYIFAHDDSADGIIQCGTFTTDGSGNANITLGWEPQYLLIKQTNTTGPWFMFDTARAWGLGNIDRALLANSSAAEDSTPGQYGDPTGSGFTGANLGGSATYVYLAIRKGLMRPPTDASKVFDIVARTGTGAAATITTPGIKTGVDLLIAKRRNATLAHGWWDRLRGVSAVLTSDSTAAEAGGSIVSFNTDGITVGSNGTVNSVGNTFINYFFKQARGFLDIVGYTGTGAARTVPHNLGAVPELMIVKNRTSAGAWGVFPNDPTKALRLNDTSVLENGFWNNTAPSDNVFSIGVTSFVNSSGNNYIAYLFASCPGVSKIDTYTGTGAAQNINCGFAAGARFVMIKRIDATDAWYYVDTVRGIVVGNDPFLMFNSTAAEATAAVAEPYAPGFTVSSALAVSGGTYLYFSVA